MRFRSLFFACVLVLGCGDRRQEQIDAFTLGDGGGDTPRADVNLQDAFMLPDMGMMEDAYMEPDAWREPDAWMPDAWMPDAWMPPPVSNDTCESARMIGPGTLMASSLGARNDYAGGMGCSGTLGPDVVYAIDVPAGNLLRVRVRGTSDFNPSINLVRSAVCTGSSPACIASNDGGLAGDWDEARYLNRGSSPERIYAIVDTARATSLGGPFELEVVLVDMPPATAGERCEDAGIVSPGTYMGTTVGATNDYGAGTGCSGVGGPDVVYGIDVPAGRRLTVTLDSTDPDFDPSLSLVGQNCGGTPRVCLRSSDRFGMQEVLRWDNTGGETARIYAVVDSFFSSEAGPFTITFAIDAIPPAPDGERCTNPQRIDPGTYTHNLMGYENDFGTGPMCAGVAGVDRVYVISVPPNHELTASVRGRSSDFDPSISLQLSCVEGAGRMCVAGDDAGGATTLNTVRWRNMGSMAQDVFIVVDTFSSTSAGGEYEFTVRLVAPP
ncbi:MAG: hypothetical protein NZM37_10560 [Sandaracinaceae bacterium]|nr:hypothetical protein [Sandaracinaceae bacterium]